MNNTQRTVAPVRVQLSILRGWRMPPNTVMVCRPSKFGNPFVVGVDGTASECVEKYAMDIYHPNGRVGFEVVDIATLRGKNLACWCKIGEPCHADVLLDLANYGITDGFGSEWSAWCATCGRKSMSVCRPGEAQCNHCG